MRQISADFGYRPSLGRVVVAIPFLLAIASVVMAGLNGGNVTYPLAVVAVAGSLVVAGWMVQRDRYRIARGAETDRAWRDAIALACHDLRTGITVSRAYISMLDDGSLGPLPDQAKAALPMVAVRVAEMDVMVQRVLATACNARAPQALTIERLDLCHVAAHMLRAQFPLLSPQHHVQFLAPRQSVWVMADGGALVSILGNLLSNATKYSPRGGLITCEVKCLGPWAQVSITDEGVGIAPEELPRLFQPFVRIQTEETRRIRGSGIGLYLSRELARRQSGDIDAESQQGVGSRFTLTLPLAK